MLKPGYKQTDLGVLPEDWKITELGKCLTQRPDYGINAPAVRYDPALPAYLRITDISENGQFIREGGASVNHHASNDYVLAEGDIVLARTGASVGKSYQYDPNDGQLVFAGFLIRVKTNPTKLNAKFLRYYLQTPAYWKWVLMTSMRSGQPGINGNEYALLPIPLPPPAEQRAIADALGAVDALLTQQRELLAKKRALKQATQQTLLSKEKRLPGFEGEWKEGEIGNLALKVGSGITPTGGVKVYQESGRPFVRSQNVGWGRLILDDISYISEEIHNAFNSTEIQQNDVLLNITGASIGRAAVADYRIVKGNVNQHVCIIRVNNDRLCPFYLCHFLISHAGQEIIQSFQAGGNRQGLNFAQIKTISIPLPTLDEQRAIATILSDMDAELETLAAQIEKTQALKQGMMQNLLTGAIRLVPTGGGAAIPTSSL
ncbi:restriction endonuclease subunit S [Hymenobacter gummosus]|uniref:Restriction endonuclease subunit S n=1 Tax=Hymenobacter gummosus TaxID=1776032 RepID=A0A431U6R7_9BACT|nr:restriction endonuclease subunit S [Hymenobacter gummosus]RTQ52314.1 restriction endonuclease subunit S [Hymenobacter gummosus]